MQKFNSFRQLGSFLKKDNEVELARSDGRRFDEIRPITVSRNYLKYAEGSVLIEAGQNRIVCSATVEEKVPIFLRGSGQGWISAEYSMLPRATSTRNMRDAVRGKIGGRAHEIQRLIGRSLRSVINLDELGERTILIDCDVIQADGGTRTLAISGSFVALIDALWNSLDRGMPARGRLVKDYLAAVSVGVVRGRELLDLSFDEDSIAQVDMNVVASGTGQFVEVQGTAEKDPFSRETLDRLLILAEKGTKDIVDLQKTLLERELP
ncbi:MAG TPA: ribonuclease PH [Atribacteraceae bacterium]|nr:ribonuclease PH [Atribacteraceae bacterium]